MALLFSAVTLTANDHDAEFLVSGIPRDTDDLAGWTAYEGFLGEIDEECEVRVHVEAYLYGEGETFRASLEEIAYFNNRLEMNSANPPRSKRVSQRRDSRSSECESPTSSGSWHSTSMPT